MIYTLTPNPALDICGTVSRLVLNEKNYVHEVVRFPGGNGINAARILTRLGTSCVACGFLGGAAGDELRQLLNQEGVQNDFVSIQDLTRSSLTVTQLKGCRQTRFSLPGPIILPTESQQLERQMKSLRTPFVLMLGGSLPNQYPAQKLLRLMESVRKRNAPVVVDCPAAILRQVIEARPVLIKPNLAEFQELVGSRPNRAESVVQAALPLTRWVPWVCVSSVEQGAVLVTRQGAWFGKGRVIQAKSTVGAGDSMLGAMLSRLAKHRMVRFSQYEQDARDWAALAQEVLRWGVAAGMATASRPTGHLGEAADISRYLNHVAIRKVELSSHRKVYAASNRLQWRSA